MKLGYRGLLGGLAVLTVFHANTVSRRKMDVSRAAPIVRFFGRAIASTLVSFTLQLPGASPSYSFDPSPSLPDLTETKTFALPASGTCALVIQEIFARANSRAVAQDVADMFLAVTGNTTLDAIGPYKTFEEVRAALDSIPPTECPKSVDDALFGSNFSIYVFRRIDGLFYRVFRSTPQCWSRIDDDNRIICSDLVAQPGAAAVRFVNPPEDSQVDDFFREYGLEPGGSGFVSAIGTYYTFSVPIGQEEAWVRALRFAPNVAEVSRFAMKTASVSAEEMYAQAIAANGTIRSPLSFEEMGLGLSQSVRETLNFLAGQYGPKGKVTVIKQTDKRLSIEVSGLRGEVISAGGWWELLIIDCIFSGSGPTTTLYLILSGEYATGAGAILPARDEYAAMDKQYYRELSEYCQGLITSVKKNLEDGK